MFKLSNTSQNNSLDSINYFESGRSLLETLAVLAIMALIGAVGVKGFTVAMNRHRANELLNEANKRATVVASQVLLGKEGNIDDFPKIPGYDFKVLPPKNKKFSLTLTKDDEQHSPIDSDICEQMKALIGEDGIVKIAESCDNASALTLTFNEDLSKGVDITSSDYDNNKSACESNTDYKYCEDAKTCILKIESCPTIRINCDNYPGTGLEDEMTYTGGTAGLASDNETYCKCRSGYKWDNVNLTCVDIIGGEECFDYINNSDCGGKNSPYYCRLDDDIHDEPVPHCSDKGKGTCVSLPTTNWGTTLVGNHDYYIADMSWFTANALCVAHGSTGLIISELEGIKMNISIWEESDRLYRLVGKEMAFWTRYSGDGTVTNSNVASCTACEAYAYTGAGGKSWGIECTSNRRGTLESGSPARGVGAVCE